MCSDQDAISVLQWQILIYELSVHLHWILSWIFFIRNQSWLSLIAVEIETTLLVGNTDAFDIDWWCELSAGFADEIVAFVKCKLDHAAHARVLIDVSKLWCGFESGFFGLAQLLIPVLLVQLPFKFSFFLSKFLLLLSLQLKKCFFACSTAATLSRRSYTPTATDPKSFDLFSELSDKFVLGRLIHHGLVLDCLYLPSVTQSTQSLIEIDWGRRQSCHHRCLGIAAKEWLKDHSQLALTIWHLFFLGLAIGFLGQYTDNTSKNGKTLVDVSSFFEAITGGTCGFGTLWPRQVDEVDVGDEFTLRFARFFVFLYLLENNAIHCVCTTWRSIHGCLSNCSIFISYRQLSLNRLIAVHGHVTGVLDVDAKFGMLTHIQTFFRSLSWFHEQILYLLVVDFNHGNRYLAFYDLWGVRLELGDSLEDLFAGPRHDALVLAITHHWVTLARSRLPIGEKTCIVAGKSVI